MANRKYKAVLVIGFILAAAGLLLFVAVADSDYKYEISSTSESRPGEGDVRIYDTLSDRQKSIFDRAANGETVRFEDDPPPMPETVVKNGTYYTSGAPRYYDWTNPRTFGPILLFLIGAGVSVAAVRTDIERWPV